METDEGLIATTLRAHNHFRSLHQVAPLEWDYDCHEAAQRWAEQLAREASGPKYGGLGRRMGQNVWWGPDAAATADDAVAAWMREGSGPQSVMRRCIKRQLIGQNR